MTAKKDVSSREERPKNGGAGEANPSLHCLGGNPVPDQILVAWREFEGLPVEARNQIWDVLAPYITDGLNDEVANLSAKWCQEHEVSPEALEHSIDACHFLISQAARLNLDEPLVREDIEAISSAGQPGLKALMTHFEEMKRFLRQRILEGTLLDHGKVFTGIDWRIDMIGASDRGLQLDMVVALLTLRHQEGYGDQTQKGKTSLYLTPEAVSELKRVCNQLEDMFEAANQKTRH